MDEIKSQQQNNSENVYLDTEITIDEVKNDIQEKAETWSDTMNYIKIKQLPKKHKKQYMFCSTKYWPHKRFPIHGSHVIFIPIKTPNKNSQCADSSRLPLI